MSTSSTRPSAGAARLGQHPDLLRLDVKASTESGGDLRVLKVDKVVYGQKATVKEDFRDITSPDRVRFSPIQHFTDTKIRLHALVFVLALSVLKVMAVKARDLGLSMNGMTQELSHIQKAALVDGPTSAVHTMSKRSTLQQRLVDVFALARDLRTVCPCPSTLGRHVPAASPSPAITGESPVRRPELRRTRRARRRSTR